MVSKARKNSGATAIILSQSSREGDLSVADTLLKAEKRADSRIEHRLQVEGALVKSSRMLISNDAIDFEKLLGTVGEAVGADCVYLVTIPPDEQLIRESGAQPAPEYSLDGTSRQDIRSYIPNEQGKSVTVWQRSGSTRNLDWLQSTELSALLERDASVPPESPDKSQQLASPIILAVPILSSKDKLYGYLGFEYEEVPHEWLDEDGRVLSVLGDLLSSYFERKLASQAQSESEGRWRTLVERNPEPILIIADGTVLYTNDSGIKLLGGSSSEPITGRHCRDFISAEHEDTIQKWSRVMCVGAVGPVEQTIICLDGDERYVEWFSVPVLYKGQRAAQVVIRDITERKLAERALQESEKRFRILADSAPVQIWMSDANANGTYFNQTWLTFTGRTLADEIGEGWLNSIHPDDVENFKRTFHSHLERQEGFRAEFSMRRFDGKYRWILCTGMPRHTPDGTFVGYIGSCLDITERKEAMEAIRASEERYRTFVETISEAIWRIELDKPMPLDLPLELQVEFVARHGVVAECNDALAHLIGFENQDQLVGSSIHTFFEHFESSIFTDFVRSGYQLRNGEFSVDHPRVGRKHLVVNAVGTVEKEGLVRIWGSCVDVSERIELEQQMVAALEQQQQRFGRDLHDGVGQLLTAVRMLSSNLAERFFQDNEDGYQLAQKVVRFSEEASQRVREIHNGLAPFQLYQDGLSVVLQDLASDIHALPGVSCTFVSDGITEIRERDTMLHLYRIAQEATNNSLKYARCKNIIISLTTEEEGIVLQVKDDGVGFDVNGRHNGKSLGLRSMYYRARSIGGLLIIDSRSTGKEKGTTVKCVLPFRNRQGQSTESAITGEGSFPD